MVNASIFSLRTLEADCIRSALHEIVSIHDITGYGPSTESHLWNSYPRSDEEEERSNNVWLKGHTGKRMSSRNTSHPVLC